MLIYYSVVVFKVLELLGKRILFTIQKRSQRNFTSSENRQSSSALFTLNFLCRMLVTVTCLYTSSTGALWPGASLPHAGLNNGTIDPKVLDGYTAWE
jgi:hypothetical protein